MKEEIPNYKIQLLNKSLITKLHKRYHRWDTFIRGNDDRTGRTIDCAQVADLAVFRISNTRFFLNFIQAENIAGTGANTLAAAGA